MKSVFIAVMVILNIGELFSQEKVRNDTIINQIRLYAENYNPLVLARKDTFFIPNIPMPNDKMHAAFIAAYKNNPDDIIKYISLIVLKVYRAQSEYTEMTYNFCEHGGREDDNVIEYIFLKYSKLCNPDDNLYCDLVHLLYGYEWIKKQKTLMRYDKIKTEIKKIEKLDKAYTKKSKKLYPED
jgi:hypothetical protein